jgi:hypothetical protein
VQNYKGVKAPVRKAVAVVSKDAYERFLKGDLTAVPHWMQVRDGDSEKQREKKLRTIKAFKKKLRCALRMEFGTWFPFDVCANVWLCSGGHGGADGSASGAF